MYDVPVSEDRDIITLQLGTLSNRIGAHFWNLQQRYLQVNPDLRIPNTTPSIFNPDVLFESTVSLRRPRLLALDWHDSVDFDLPSDWVPQVDHRKCSLWDGKIDTIFRSPMVESSDNEANQSPYWTSCLAPPERRRWFDQNIAYLIPEASSNRFGNTDLSVTSFFQGMELLTPGRRFFDDVEDRLRHLIERCSLLNGLQLVVDGENAFGGMASRLLEYMDEELPKRSLLTIPVFDTLATSQLGRQEQLVVQANQLALLLHLEPAMNHLSHGAWLPLDLSSPSTSTEFCFNSSLLAATLDAATSWVRLNDSDGGVSLHEFISTSQHSHGKRMFSPRIGYSTDYETGGWLTCKSLSPYHLHSDTKPIRPEGSILWRQVVPRGIPVAHLSRYVTFEAAVGENGTEHPSSEFQLPKVQPGASVRMITAGANLPMEPPLNTKTKLPWCDQPSCVSMLSVLDVPGSESSESEGLKSLVYAVKKTSSHPPFQDVERDLWREYLDLAETYLVDAYSN